MKRIPKGRTLLWAAIAVFYFWSAFMSWNASHDQVEGFPIEDFPRGIAMKFVMSGVDVRAFAVAFNKYLDGYNDDRKSRRRGDAGFHMVSGFVALIALAEAWRQA